MAGHCDSQTGWPEEIHEIQEVFVDVLTGFITHWLCIQCTECWPGDSASCEILLVFLYLKEYQIINWIS